MEKISLEAKVDNYLGRYSGGYGGLFDGYGGYGGSNGVYRIRRSEVEIVTMD